MPHQQSFMNRWIQFRNPDPTRPGERWPILVVARLDPGRRGPHYPLAAVTTHSSSLAVLTACANALRIFSDPLNYLAIRSELSLAYDFYTQKIGIPSPDGATEWVDRSDFPFITTCLAIGATRDEDATNHNIWQIPLSKVYHYFERDYDNSRHRMVVIDVTDPTNVRYAFGYEAPYHYHHEPLTDRPTSRLKPLSATDLLAACRFFGGTRAGSEEFKSAFEITCRWKVMDVPKLDFGWPHAEKPFPPVANPPRSLRDQVFMTLVRGTAEMESLDISVFDHVRAIPNFQRDLRQHLIKHSSHLGDRQATAQLIALALEGQEQLDLTPFKNLSARSISTILGSQSADITSISLCADTLKCTPQDILQVLARFPTIQNLYLANGENHQFSLKIFTEMLKVPSLLPKGHILVADLLSTPLCWSRCRYPIPLAYQIPFDIFPVQHMFVRHQTYGSDLNQERFWPNYFPMGDLFLRPERFAAGFIQYILKSVQPGSIAVESSEKLFDFCTAPTTLNRMYEDYQISQIPLESSSIPLRPHTSRRRENVGDCWPLLRTIEPNSWTVLVSLHHNRARDLESLATRAHHTTNWARYAFVRTKSRIDVTRPPVKLPEEIEVVGLKEFLRITSPDTDPALVDMRLAELEEKAAIPRQQPLPHGVKRLTVMDYDEAVGILKDFLDNVEMVKKNLWAFMKENDENRWYPDLLAEANGQLYGSMVHGPDDTFVDSVNAQLSLEWWESDPEEDEDQDDDGDVE